MEYESLTVTETLWACPKQLERRFYTHPNVTSNKWWSACQGCEFLLVVFVQAVRETALSRAALFGTTATVPNLLFLLLGRSVAFIGLLNFHQLQTFPCQGVAVASLFCFLLAVVIQLVDENEPSRTQLFLIRLCVILTHFLHFLLLLSASVTLWMPPSVWTVFTAVRADCLSSPQEERTFPEELSAGCSPPSHQHCVCGGPDDPHLLQPLPTAGNSKSHLLQCFRKEI